MPSVEANSLRRRSKRGGWLYFFCRRGDGVAVSVVVRPPRTVAARIAVTALRGRLALRVDVCRRAEAFQPESRGPRATAEQLSKLTVRTATTSTSTNNSQREQHRCRRSVSVANKSYRKRSGGCVRLDSNKRTMHTAARRCSKLHQRTSRRDTRVLPTHRAPRQK